mmetsp:Transcript_4161/g.11632  ORF Transcript_4161/g.11632 Transcript_4161/m.11632 type:complete len:426 (+) Transcript_4161:1351-2628(+)
MLQPPVPLPGCRARAAVHHGRAPDREQRQDDAAGQAAAQAAGPWVSRAHLLPDDPPAGHPGGLLLVPEVPVLPHRREHARLRPRGRDRQVQRAGLGEVHLPAVHARRRPGHQPRDGRHRRAVRQRLEPAGGPAGDGPCAPHRAEEGSPSVPLLHRQQHRGEDHREGVQEAEAGRLGHPAGPPAGEQESHVQGRPARDGAQRGRADLQRDRGHHHGGGHRGDHRQGRGGHQGDEQEDPGLLRVGHQVHPGRPRHLRVQGPDGERPGLDRRPQAVHQRELDRPGDEGPQAHPVQRERLLPRKAVAPARPEQQDASPAEDAGHVRLPVLQRQTADRALREGGPVRDAQAPDGPEEGRRRAAGRQRRGAGGPGHPIAGRPSAADPGGAGGAGGPAGGGVLGMEQARLQHLHPRQREARAGELGGDRRRV